jgi:hypothetical protein
MQPASTFRLGIAPGAVLDGSHLGRAVKTVPQTACRGVRYWLAVGFCEKPSNHSEGGILSMSRGMALTTCRRQLMRLASART